MLCQDEGGRWLLVRAASPEDLFDSLLGPKLQCLGVLRAAASREKEDTAATGAQKSDDKTDKTKAKSMLAGLFSRMGAPPGVGGPRGPLQAWGKGAMEEDEQPLAASIPTPPPLPTEWPPDLAKLCFQAGSANGSAGAGTGTGADDSVMEEYDGPRLRPMRWEVIDPPSATAAQGQDQTGDDGAKLFGKAAKLATLWESDVMSSHDLEELFPDIVHVFAMKGQAEIKLVSNRRRAKPTRTVGLDPKRAQSINIMLTKFSRVDPARVVATVGEMNTALIGAEALRALLSNVPTQDDIESVVSFVKQRLSEGRSAEEGGADGPSSSPSPSPSPSLLEAASKLVPPLDKADFFVLAAGEVDAYEHKLEACACEASLTETVASMREKCDLVSAAVNEIMSNEKLRLVLHSLLQIGNKLNRGRARAAKGFKLSSIGTITGTRSTDGCSVMDYAMERLCAQFEGLEDLSDEFPALPGAKIVTFESVHTQLKKLSAMLDVIGKIRSSESNRTDGSRAPILERLGVVEKRISQNVGTVSDMLGVAREAFSTLCVYISEDEAKTNIAGAFQIVGDVITAITESVARINRKRRS
jgi:hypothetical protein